MAEHDVWAPPAAPAMSAVRQRSRREQVMAMIEENRSEQKLSGSPTPPGRRTRRIGPLLAGGAAAVAISAIVATSHALPGNTDRSGDVNATSPQSTTRITNIAYTMERGTDDT